MRPSDRLRQTLEGDSDDDEGHTISRPQLVAYFRSEVENTEDPDKSMVRVLKDLKKGDGSAHPAREASAHSLRKAYPGEGLFQGDRAAGHVIKRANEHVRMSVSRLFAWLDRDYSGLVRCEDFARALQEANEDAWTHERIAAVVDSLPADVEQGDGASSERELTLEELRKVAEAEMRGEENAEQRIRAEAQARATADAGRRAVPYGQFLQWALNGDNDAAEAISELGGRGFGGGEAPLRTADGRWRP